MRTTVTLDPDVHALVRKTMRERHLSFKDALNQAVRSGLAAPPPAPTFRTPTFHMGVEPTIRLDKALRLAAELEDDELIRRLATRK
jgi:hypothetical protein